MLRADREVTDFQQIISIIEECDVCRLGLNGAAGLPYILPLNFACSVENETITLYFHSAVRGLKHELIARNPEAAFEMDCAHKLTSDPARGYCTMSYRSVMGSGRILYVTDPEEKLAALTLLTDRYHKEYAPNHFPFNPAAIPRTAVYKLVVDQITAKRKN